MAGRGDRGLGVAVVRECRPVVVTHLCSTLITHIRSQKEDDTHMNRLIGPILAMWSIELALAVLSYRFADNLDKEVEEKTGTSVRINKRGVPP